jgi:hypothetical protein
MTRSRFGRQRPTSILEQVARIRRAREAAPRLAAQEGLARILDGLNTWGALEAVRAAHFTPQLCFGPKAVSGLMPEPWVGAVIWHRPPGYYGYRVLTLLGVWALEPPEPKTEPVTVVIGARRLSFAAPFFEPEAYHKLIRHGFDVYYADDGRPPEQGIRLRYSDEQRLALRDQVAAALAALAV